MDIAGMKQKDLETLLQNTTDTDLPQMFTLFRADSRASVQKLADKYEKKLQKRQAEALRMEAMRQFEREAKAQGYRYIAGTDEVGRGPLAGPVVAAAVILPEDADLPEIKDSKKLSEKQRLQLDVLIREQAIAWAIAEVDQTTIDEINILEASRLAMQNAVTALSQQADYVLVDGLPNPRITLPGQAIVKGDNRSISIAAASIIAKVYRDNLMDEYDKVYPGYGFAGNKGYPTEEHMQAVRTIGPCAIHRMTFRPLNELNLNETSTDNNKEENR